MSSRRRLVSHAQRGENAPTPAPRQRPSGAAASRPTTVLPPYEAPSCPLTDESKQALERLQHYDYTKYKKHLTAAIKCINGCAGDSNDLVHERDDQVKRIKARQVRLEKDGVEYEKTELEEEAERKAETLEQEVDNLTTKAEKALRDLIDYQAELANQPDLMQKVRTTVDNALAKSRDKKRQKLAAVERKKAAAEDLPEDEKEEKLQELEEEREHIEAEALEAETLSPTEVYKKACEDFEGEYKSASMRERYGESNDYKQFKSVVHNARHGDNAPPVPHASTWFSEGNASSGRRRRHMSSTDNAGNGYEQAEEDDDDDDIIITGEKESLQCPLTLKMFREPYSNNVCKHTFEKNEIIQYHEKNAVAFTERGGRSARKVKCPATSCDKMLELSDFYDDALMLRKVKRARQAEAEAEEDEEPSYMNSAPGTRSNRPATIDDDEDDGFEVVEEDARRRAQRVKKERMSTQPAPVSTQATVIDTTADDDDDDE